MDPNRKSLSFLERGEHIRSLKIWVYKWWGTGFHSMIFRRIEDVEYRSALSIFRAVEIMTLVHVDSFSNIHHNDRCIIGGGFAVSETLERFSY
jgi:hypothetical protein